MSWLPPSSKKGFSPESKGKSVTSSDPKKSFLSIHYAQAFWALRPGDPREGQWGQRCDNLGHKGNLSEPKGSNGSGLGTDTVLEHSLVPPSQALLLASAWAQICLPPPLALLWLCSLLLTSYLAQFSYLSLNLNDLSFRLPCPTDYNVPVDLIVQILERGNVITESMNEYMHK